MVGLVLDASYAIDFVTGPADRLARIQATVERIWAEGAAVPPVWSTEVANALIKRLRRKLLTEEEAYAAFSRLNTLPVLVVEDDPRYVWSVVFSLARLRQISVYDAGYVALAASLKLPLATSDSGMRQAALAAGIPLLD